MGFSRQEYKSGLPCSPPGDLPNPAIKPASFRSFVLAGGFLTISTTWVLCVDHYQTENYAMDIFTEHIGLTHEHCTSHYILLFPHSYTLVIGQKCPFLLLPYNKTHRLAVTHCGTGCGQVGPTAIRLLVSLPHVWYRGNSIILFVP